MLPMVDLQNCKTVANLKNPKTKWTPLGLQLTGEEKQAIEKIMKQWSVAVRGLSFSHATICEKTQVNL